MPVCYCANTPWPADIYMLTTVQTTQTKTFLLTYDRNNYIMLIGRWQYVNTNATGAPVLLTETHHCSCSQMLNKVPFSNKEGRTEARAGVGNQGVATDKRWSPFLHYVSYNFTAVSPGLLAGPMCVCISVCVCLLCILCSTPSWGRQIEAGAAEVWV